MTWRRANVVRLAVRSVLALAVLFEAYAAAYALYSRPPRAPWTIAESFESSGLGALDRPGARQTCCAHSLQVVATPARNGAHALRVELDAGDPLVRGNHRAEIRLPAARQGSSNDYAFSIFIPPDWEEDATGTIVAQWHSVPDRWLGEGFLPSPLQLVVARGRWELSSAWDDRAVVRLMSLRGAPRHHDYPLSLQLEKGRWVDWSFHVRWSDHAPGSLQVRKDGVLVLDRTGPNTYDDAIGPYFKFGLYAPDWLGADRSRHAATRVAYFDAIAVTQQP